MYTLHTLSFEHNVHTWTHTTYVDLVHSQLCVYRWVYYIGSVYMQVLNPGQLTIIPLNSYMTLYVFTMTYMYACQCIYNVQRTYNFKLHHGGGIGVRGVDLTRIPSSGSFHHVQHEIVDGGRFSRNSLNSGNRGDSFQELYMHLLCTRLYGAAYCDFGIDSVC